MCLRLWAGRSPRLVTVNRTEYGAAGSDGIREEI